MPGARPPHNDTPAAPSAEQRIDRWLCNVRLFKTRGLAVEAIDNGRVEINGARAKASKLVKVGDRVRVQRPPYIYDVEVLGTVPQRVGAPIAQALYRESEESIAARAALREREALTAVREEAREGKLGKHERRERERLKRAW
ncbi:MAG: RNA-binding S4 domain-containing protein [Gammaproteobacteria bacterium]|nr:RNA-binding S4 domain-containing protein [Gammaproteobacteria bacterium]